MSSGLRDFSTTFISRLLAMLISLGTQACLAWVLGPGDRGSYAVCMVFATLLTLVFMLGSDIACMYYVASKRFTLSEGVAQTLVSGGLGSFVAIAVGLVLLRLPLEFVQKADPLSLHLSLALVPVGFYASTFSSLFTSLRDFQWSALISVSIAACQLVLVLALVLGLQWGVTGAVLAVIASQALGVAISLVLFRRRYELKWARPTLEGLRDTFSYGIRFYVGKVSNLLNVQLGTVVLSMFASREMIGLFDVANQLTMRVTTVPDALVTILMPRVAGDPSGRRELVAQSARVTLVVCGVLLLVMGVFAPQIVGILFSSAFLPAVPLIRLLAAATLLIATAKVFVAYLTCVNRPGIASAAIAAGVVANLVLLVLLLPVMGLMGAAIAMAGNYLVTSVALTAVFHRLSGLGLMDVWKPRRADWSQVVDLLRSMPGRLLCALRGKG